MNLSGQAIGYLAAHFGVPFARSEILVVVDDLSLPLGQTRLRKKGSSGGHNGLKSIEAYLCSTEYARLRLGIGQPEPGGEVIDYVLSPFASFEQQTVSQVVAFSAQAAEDWCRRVSFESLVGKVNGWRPQGNRNDGEEV
jgi:PTH1 family peptidyl-tRNA hydrolase